MKEFTKEMVDDIIRIRYGQMVSSARHVSFISCKDLGKVFKVSGAKIYQLCQQRFEKERQKKLPFLQQLQLVRDPYERKRWGGATAS